MEMNKEINDFIEENINERIDKVVLKIRNQFDFDPEFIINQINGRKKIFGKIPSWSKTEGLVFPNIVSLEQCSSELTGKYKASLINGDRLIDMTGGFGVDSYFFSKSFKRIYYIEKNKELVECVANNFKQLKADHIAVHIGDGVEFLEDFTGTVDWIFIDPARRGDQNKKVFLFEDIEPDITQIKDLLFEKSADVLVKLSPMLDLTQAMKQMAEIKRVFIVSVKNECKELIIHLSNKAVPSDIPIVCVDIKGEDEIDEFMSSSEKRKSENVALTLSDPLDYIYEPNKSIMKGGVQNDLAAQMGLSKIGVNSNFFTSADEMITFPGRVFRKVSVIQLRKKLIKKFLVDGKANIIARNFPLKASQIYDKFRIKPGGKYYFLATKLRDGSNVLMVCERL
ncbi:MAG: 16S rRNA G966 N2-methylase RsmD, partial [Saprospiraceae bacterium]